MQEVSKRFEPYDPDGPTPPHRTGTDPGSPRVSGAMGVLTEELHPAKRGRSSEDSADLDRPTHGGFMMDDDEPGDEQMEPDEWSDVDMLQPLMQVVTGDVQVYIRMQD